MKAAILKRLNSELEIHDFVLPNLEFGQVLVRVVQSGLCGAQIQEIQGLKGNERFLPHMLGHEGFGEVLDIGPGVSKISPGQMVTLHWREGSGITANPAKLKTTAGESFGAGPVVSFASHVIVSESRVTALEKDIDPELGALLGCALTTAWGVVHKQMQLGPKSRVAVLGCGGLGLSLISVLAHSGVGTIVGIDSSAAKNSLAVACGANFFGTDLTQDVDAIIDTTGVSSLVGKSVQHLPEGGVVALLVNNSDKYTFDSQKMFAGKGLTIFATQGGGTNPDRDIPDVAEIMKACPDLWKPLITHRFELSRINDAIKLLRTGAAGRILIQTGEA